MSVKAKNVKVTDAQRRKNKLATVKLRVRKQEKKVKALDKLQIQQGKVIERYNDLAAREENAQSTTLAKLQMQSDKLDALYDSLRELLNPPFQEAQEEASTGSVSPKR